MPTPRISFLPPALAVLTLIAPGQAPSVARPPGGEDLAAMYRDTAERILDAAMKDEEGWEKLTWLTTVIGNRLSGSERLEQAIDWAIERMRAEGFDQVVRQPVKVPHWVRGEEGAWVIEPSPRRLPMLGLGGSVGTSEDGVVAEVVTVASFDELDALPRSAVEGRIVVFAVPWEGYGRTVRYRSSGASRAAAKGARGVLVRSATGRSLATPHTGALRYADDQPKVPAAAITLEDAEWFARMERLGRPVVVRLEMGARTLPDADSANVIAEIRGSERPDEVVVMGGHYDSWDVGQGAHDDGAACIAAWQALKLLKNLGLRPKRTLRVVLWTNEENGLAGGTGYRDWIGDGVKRHVAAIEMDGGAERPVGFGLGIDPAAMELALARLRPIGALLERIEAGEITGGGGGADIGPLMREGVPGLALRTTGEHYFDWHHTDADTLDKVEPENLRRATGMLAVMGFVLADMEGTLGG
ncbi:MAG TPA: M20/M25/M40 family metallo-hydrolase [Thermoanaerobaculia bacterium]|nr:M20/M25/M40 family metallo-hydrolase [Thermoanaerobaculia bacterium]